MNNTYIHRHMNSL